MTSSRRVSAKSRSISGADGRRRSGGTESLSLEADDFHEPQRTIGGFGGALSEAAADGAAVSSAIAKAPTLFVAAQEFLRVTGGEI